MTGAHYAVFRQKEVVLHLSSLLPLHSPNLPLANALSPPRPQVDWNLLIFFAMLFIVMGGVNSTGLPELSWSYMLPAFLPLSSIGSAGLIAIDLAPASLRIVVEGWGKSRDTRDHFIMKIIQWRYTHPQCMRLWWLHARSKRPFRFVVQGMYAVFPFRPGRFEPVQQCAVVPIGSCVPL